MERGMETSLARIARFGLISFHTFWVRFWNISMNALVFDATWQQLAADRVRMVV